MSSTAGTSSTDGKRKGPGAIRLFLWAFLFMLFGWVGYILLILTVVFGGLIWIWFLIPVFMFFLKAGRRYVNFYRRWNTRVMGLPTPSAYKPIPEGSWFRKLVAIFGDPATWLDLAWLVVNSTLGFAVNLAVVIASPFVGWMVNPYLMRFYGVITQAMLAPSRSAVLASRVEELASSRAETVDAHATELRRVERDLHDGAQARLVALGMSLGMAEEAVDRDPETLRELLAEARTTSSEALAELRDLVRGIHPPVLADRGLAGAVRALGMACTVPTDVEISLPARPSAPVESAAYFAVSEALTNVMKHSEAQKAWVRISYDDGRLLVLVGDDGKGGADVDGGTGIRGLERRLSAFDGTVFLSSPPGGPTVVSMDLPCELPAADPAP